MNTYHFALDLKDDPEIIAAYDRWHQNDHCWPEIRESIRLAGIRSMQIYRTGNRLFMVMTTDPGFSFEGKALLDAENEKVGRWEELMWKYQQPLPWARPGEKWVLLEEIFRL